jgi:hypothetical protein
MFPTNKSEPKHLRIEGTSHARKSTKIAPKRPETPTSHNPRIDASFHSLGGQILYKRRKNLTLWSKEMRSSSDGWFAWKP